MPVKYNKKAAPPADDRYLGTLRDWIAGGTRVVGGVLAAPGGWAGFASGAGSELLAQAIEEGSLNQFDKTSLARAGAEGTIGLIPFAKTFKMGKAGASALLGGGFNLVGDLGRQYAEGNFDEGFEPRMETNEKGQLESKGWNYGRTALATLLGGAGGAVAGKWYHGPKAPPKTDPVIEHTSIPAGGQRASAGGKPMSGYAPRAAGPVAPPTGPKFDRSAYPVGVDDVPTTVTPDVDEGRFASEFERLFSQNIDKAGKASRSTVLTSLDDAITAETKYGDRIRRGSARRESDAKAFENTSNKLDLEFQDAVRSKHEAMDLEDEASLLAEYKAKWAAEDAAKAKAEIEATQAGLVKQPPTVSRTVKEGGKTKTERWTAPKEDDIEGVPVDPVARAAQATTRAPAGDVSAVKQVLTPKSKVKLPRNVKALLGNLDEAAKKDFDEYIVTGVAPSAAYRKAFELMQRRAAKGAPTAAAENPVSEVQKLVTPKASVPRETPQLKQTTHPSFYETGFEGLEDASAAAPRTPSPAGPPPGSPAAAKLAEAERTFPKDALEELKRLSAIYNDPNTSKEGKRITGELLREMGKKFGPKADGSTPQWVSEQSAAVDKLAKGKKKGRNVTLGAGLGAGQDALAIARENPQFAASTVSTILGAAIGAGFDEEGSNWDGALAGAGAGLGVSLAPKLVQALGRDPNDLGNAAKVKEMAAEIFRKLPQVQRASMLTSTNLPANAWLGPWGSVVTSAIEDILKGDPRGLPLLKAAWNPAAFAKQMWSAKDEAKELIRKGEMGRDAVDDRLGSQSGQLSAIDEMTILPGQMMTSGDVVARRILQSMGYSDDEARVRTLTSEPVNQYMRQLANLGKGSWLGNMMLPFKRTPANIAEQGAYRTPALGAIANRGRNVSAWDAGVEQGLGGAIGAGAYGAASNIEDPTARRRARAWVTNPAGRYSLPANLGWLLGDAHASQRDLGQVLGDRRTYEYGASLPLPTVDPMLDAGKVAKNIYNNDVDQVTDVIPDAMEFRELRRMMSVGADAVGFDDLAKGIYQQPRRGVRYNRRPRRQSQ